MRKHFSRIIGTMLIIMAALSLVGCGLATPASSVAEPTAASATPMPAQQQAVSLDTSAAKTSSAASPATSDIVREGGLLPEETLLMNLYEEHSPSVVRIRVVGQLNSGEGSGFVWDTSGHIVTNYHVVADADLVDVSFKDGSLVEADIIGLDPQSDIAVLKVDPTKVDLRPVTPGDSDAVKVGQMALAIGNPYGQTWTMTRGIISAVGRVIPSGQTRYSIPDMIQTDAAINPGNSGGPLLDSQGRVIGMNTLILSSAGVSSGVGFAVPINIIKLVVPDLIEKGYYAYSWLGISGRDVLPQDVEVLDLPVKKGALVTEIMPGGPADEAGLRGSRRIIRIEGEDVPTGGDVIIAIDGTSIEGMDELIAYLVHNTKPGQQVTLTVIRDGKEMSVPITLGERPQE